MSGDSFTHFDFLVLCVVIVSSASEDSSRGLSNGSSFLFFTGYFLIFLALFFAICSSS